MGGIVARSSQGDGAPLASYPFVELVSPVSADERPDQKALARVLGEVATVLEAAMLPYAVIGGMASAGMGRPRSTKDIDILVRPEDAEQVVHALAAGGFRTELTDHFWLYKAFKEGVLVDIIFRSTGNIYLDQEMLEHVKQTRLGGNLVRVVPPEDLLIMKAVVHDENGPRHWHDALGLIGSGNLDWEYLQTRALRAPRRVLSLLIYAHSLDLFVPNHVIRFLFEHVYPI
jgi:predicted nucleotidyltransferase